MKKPKPTITIGIPAYNEMSNIKKLIEDVLAQDYTNLLLKKIIISSDGSTDKTIACVKSVSDKRVRIIINQKREGIARGLNQIICRTNSNVLIFLDADIRIHDKKFLQKLVTPIISENVDLTSSAIKERTTSSLLAKILSFSMVLKNVLFTTFKHGNNIYTCHGLARAFSYRFYKKLHFPFSIGNDMYSYLACIIQGKSFRYVPKSVAWYRIPENVMDHQKQSIRFFSSLKEQTKYFGNELVKNETRIPLYTYMITAFSALPLLLRNPLFSGAYFVIQLYFKVKSIFVMQNQAWDIAISTKKT